MRSSFSLCIEKVKAKANYLKRENAGPQTICVFHSVHMKKIYSFLIIKDITDSM